MKRVYRYAIILITVTAVLRAASAFALVDAMAKNLYTNGNTKGIAQMGYYIYLADGDKGLKIINVSNPRYFVTTGVLPMPGFVEQVAVDSNDMAVLSDTKDKQIHFVDIYDKMRPELKWTLPARGDIPRAVIANAGMAFVVEYGKDPSDQDYFSGIEVFSYQPEAESIQLERIAGVRDVVVTSTHLFAAGGNHLYAYRRTSSGFEVKPETTLDFLGTEDIQSLALSGQYLFAFGTEQLYVILKPLTPIMPMPRIPIEIPGLPEGGTPRFSFSAPESSPIELTVIANARVDVEQENRKVSAAVLNYGNGLTSNPSIFILLTTLKSFGLFAFDGTTNTLSPASYMDLSTSEWIVFKNIYEETDRKIKIYDSAFSEYPYPGVLKGGIVGVGAVGDYGLGYVYFQP